MVSEKTGTLERERGNGRGNLPLGAPKHPIVAAVGGNERPPQGEIGLTGLQVLSGRIYDEYNVDLLNLADRMARYEEMRRSTSACAVMENLISLPLRAANWEVRPGENTRVGRKLAEDIHRNLFEGMSHSWDDMLREIMLGPLYGFAIHAKHWELTDGWLGWRKFKELSRATVQEWRFKDGGLAGIIQRGYDSGSEYRELETGIDDLVVWTWKKTANNPEGLGAFRQAYKHWFYMKAFEEFAALRIELQATGFIIVTPPDSITGGGITKAEMKEVVAMINRLKAGEDVGVVLPGPEWKLERLWPGNADVPFETHIDRQHQQMLQTILGQFVGYGQGSQPGTYGAQRDATSFFLLSLKAMANWVCDYFNRYCMPQIVAYNANKVKKAPYLAVGPVGLRDLQAFGNFIRSVFDNNVTIPTEVMQYLIEEAGLPEVPEEVLKKAQVLKPAAAQVPGQVPLAKVSPPPAKPSSRTPKASPA